MTRRRLMVASGLAAGLAAALPRAGIAGRSQASPVGGRDAEAVVSLPGFAFGTGVRVLVRHPDCDHATRAARAALRAIAESDALTSVQLAGSALARLNDDGELRDADPRLLALLADADAWRRASGGAFDAGVQPLWRLFDRARHERRLPDAAAVARARDRVAGTRVVLDGRTARLSRGGALTLNGINQGNAADAALAVLRAHGIGSALIDAGEFRAIGRPTEDDRWRLGVRDPRRPGALLARLAFTDRAVSTSADDVQAFSPDRRHHHIFDPSTGWSPAELASVTVLARCATDADALSTAVMVLGRDRGSALVARTPGAAALLVDKAGRLALAGDLAGIRID